MPPVQTKILKIPYKNGSKDEKDYGMIFHAPEIPGTSGDLLQSLQVDFTDEATRTNLDVAARHLRSGELVAFPTETVYGLGANALVSEAATLIYQAKNRPADNPLIVHISSLDMLQQLLPQKYKWNRACDIMMRSFWPGPLTLLFPVGQDEHGVRRVPQTVTCGQPTVGVRMPSHPVARGLIHLAGIPVAAPSANASGRPSPTKAAHVLQDLGPSQLLSYIVDGGECSVGLESTVVDAVTVPGEVRVLRPGGVSVEELSNVLRKHGLFDDGTQLRVYGKDLARSAQQESAPTTPGMKYRHYSPEAKVCMLRTVSHGDYPDLSSFLQDYCAHNRQADRHLHVGLMCATDSPLLRALKSPDIHSWLAQAESQRLSPVVNVGGALVCVYALGVGASLDMVARRMFDGLRTLDAEVAWGEAPNACDCILCEEVVETGLGLAIMNRLLKAASSTATLSR